MPLTSVTEPAVEPLNILDAKAHLRIDHSEHDALLFGLIQAAREHVEAITRRALITQTWDLFLDRFPRLIEIPKPPLQSVTSVQYIDADGGDSTVSTSVYTVDTDSEPARVYTAHSQVWPFPLAVRNAVVVRFVAGYGSHPAHVPESIRQAMLLHIEMIYDRPEQRHKNALQTSMDALLVPYRVVRF